MHIPTHILSGWCFGNLLRFTPRERAMCMLAASLPDIDGLGAIAKIWGNDDWYWDYHHKLGHNLLFGLVTSAILALFSRHRWKAAAMYVALFHLHLLMDYYGSGEGWAIDYYWPFSNDVWMNPNPWALTSWQNYTAAGLLLLWTLGIILLKRRSPLEAPMPSLDRQIVALFTRRRTHESIKA